MKLALSSIGFHKSTSIECARLDEDGNQQQPQPKKFLIFLSVLSHTLRII